MLVLGATRSTAHLRITIRRSEATQLLLVSDGRLFETLRLWFTHQFFIVCAASPRHGDSSGQGFSLRLDCEDVLAGRLTAFHMRIPHLVSGRLSEYLSRRLFWRSWRLCGRVGLGLMRRRRIRSLPLVSAALVRHNWLIGCCFFESLQLLNLEQLRHGNPLR